MSTVSRWLNWTPSQPQIIQDSPKTEVTKLTKRSSDSFVSSLSAENPIIRAPEPAPVSLSAECPYPLPEGVRLVRYEEKTPPIAVTVCSVVVDIPKFIRRLLAELDARLHCPIQIKAGDSVFELLSKLSDCGLELRLEWPPESRIIENSPETEPTKPTKLPEPPELNAHGVDITDEDIPF
ncbi:MAG TPA: hypothetical protein VKX49_18130 [Bryobacteraceae bacterium]|nr:hypothetical protein [Bryobacteraceae bacterium]